jgi:hypothetical protein
MRPWLPVLCALCLAPAPSRAADPDESPVPVVHLVAPGAPPLRPLRYQVQPGRRGRVNMTMGTKMSITLGEQALPTAPPMDIVMTFDYHVTSVAADGAMRTECEFGAMKVVEKPGLPPEMVRAVTASLEGLKGMKGYSVVDRRGVVREADVVVPATAPAAVRQMIDGLRQSMRQLSSPFPEEPVGRGARWDTTFKIVQNGLTMDQVAHVELAELSDDRGDLRFTLTQSAAPQRMHPPNTPAEVVIDLVSLASTGEGVTHFELATPVNTSGRVGIKMNMASRIQAPNDKPQEMKMAMEISMELSAAAPTLSPEPAPKD